MAETGGARGLSASFRRIFCLNLARSTERWACASDEFDRFGLEVERVESIDGASLRFEDLVARGILSPDYFHKHSSGAFGVIATSAALWRRIAAEEPGWYLILEDDVRLHPALLDHPEAWDACWRSVPAEAEFVYLGCSSPWLNGPADESTLLRYATPLSRLCVRVQKTVQGAFAYAITPQAARILLQRYLPLSTPVDYFEPTLFPVYALRRMAAPWNSRTPEGFYQAHAVWRGEVTVQLHGVVGLYPFPSTIGHGAQHTPAVASETDPGSGGDDPILDGAVLQLLRFSADAREAGALHEAARSCSAAGRHHLARLFLDVSTDALPQGGGRGKAVEPRGTARPVVAIVCDGGMRGEEWDPDRARHRGCGGSEEAVVYLAESLARLGCRVVVYGNPPADTLHGFPASNPRFVERRQLEEHAGGEGARRFDALIVWRKPWAAGELVRFAEKTLVWVHDPLPSSAFAGVPLERIEAVAWLSHFQHAAAGGHTTVPPSRSFFTSNGIVPEQFKRHAGIARDPSRCIYASNYAHGLEVLLRCWPEVKARVPEATLDVYYGWQTWRVRPPGWEAMMRQLLSELAPLGVREHGRIGHEALARELATASFWTYPCTVLETFCITGLKAQMAGCIPVYIRQGALRETVADGFHCDGPDGYADLLVEALSHARDESLLGPMRQRLRNWALEHSWDRIAVGWIERLGLGWASGAEGPEEKPIRVQLLTNWCSSEELCRLWNKMSRGDLRWGRIEATWEDRDVDYYAVFNAPPPGARIVEERTIVFPMEPRRAIESLPEPWRRPDPARFYHVRSRERFPSVCEWHLGKTWDELKTLKVPKTRVLSSVTSSLYMYPGHRRRVDFIRFLERRGTAIDIFGKTNEAGFEQYRGALPPFEKETGLFPYKYTLAAENHSERNYFTEKVVDAILSECLCFYWGCPNLEDHLDPRAFIAIDLHDFERAARTMEAAIESSEWERRIDSIRREKRRILDEYQVFPTLERIVSRLACR